MSILLLILFIACDQLKNAENTKEKKKELHGVIEINGSNGVIKSSITYIHGKRHGIAKTFYKDGKLRQEINYAYDKKHGVATTYYQNGEKYQETPYDSGMISGIRKKYRENGQIFAEIPFKDDMPGVGLKEYLIDGSLKKNYPTIVIKEKDEILREGKFTLLVSLSNSAKNVKFYRGSLEESKYLGYSAKEIYPQRKGKAEYKFYVQPGNFLMQEITLIANHTTALGNPYIIKRNYNLAIENSGY
jgi:hypothetical protein